VLLYAAFGWEPPIFAHLPAILGPDRKKLSKRHGPTGIASFQEAGYLPEALLNYLALCGWSSGTDDEILSLSQLIERFSLERVNRTGAIFDHDKLDWFNGIYIRSLPAADLAARMRPFLGPEGQRADDAALMPVAALVQDRLRTLSEAPELTDFFFADDIEYDTSLLVRPGTTAAQTAEALAKSADLASTVASFSHGELEPAYRSLCETLGLKTTQLFMSIRVACTGKTATPPLFETMEVLGKERVIERLRAAVERLEALQR
jgi:glutamyl-tRNA synthetase